MREAIKTIIQKGGIVEVSHKEKISSWYGSMKIQMYKGKYLISNQHVTFTDVEVALDYFLDNCFTSKNIGLIQSRLMCKIENFDELYDVEHPSKKLKQLFKEEGILVDEEAKVYNIQPIPQYTLKEAEKEVREALKNFNIDTFVETFRNIEDKYSLLKLSFNIYAMFDIWHKDKPNEKASPYSKSIPYDMLTSQARLDILKTPTFADIFIGKFVGIEMFYHPSGREIKRIKLNI